jgi:hypothetical protein
MRLGAFSILSISGFTEGFGRGYREVPRLDRAVGGLEAKRKEGGGGASKPILIEWVRLSAEYP